MTLNIDLTPVQEAQLLAAANAQGIAPEKLVSQLVIERLPEAFNGTSAAPLLPGGIVHRDPELVTRVKRIRGKYADMGVSVDDLHRERQADQQREAR